MVDHLKSFPLEIELCGNCSSRVWRPFEGHPEGDVPYCYHCGQGAKYSTVRYFKSPELTHLDAEET